MSLIALIAKVYIIILILRYVLTQQELVYNPIGQLVAKATNPLFKSATGLKSATDKLVLVYIAITILAFSIILGLFSGNLFIGIAGGISNFAHFLAMFFIVCLLFGSLTPSGAGFFQVLFHRIGAIWVKPVRKIIPIRSNKIVIPTIIVIVIAFMIPDIIAKATVLISAGQSIAFGRLIWVSFISFIYAFVGILSLLMLILLIRALMSWFSPDPRNQLVQFIYYVTEPIIAPVRRAVPPIAGLDFSVLIVMLGVGLLQAALNRILPALMTLI